MPNIAHKIYRQAITFMWRQRLVGIHFRIFDNEYILAPWILLSIDRNIAKFVYGNNDECFLQDYTAAHHMLWLTQCKGTPLAKLIAYEMFYDKFTK